MSDERPDHVQAPSEVEETTHCGPGCNCGASGLGRNGKLAICLVIVAAAILVLARGFVRKAATGNAQAQEAFAATLPASTPQTAAADKADATQIGQARPVAWGRTLAGLGNLNQVAARQNAVFVYLTGKGQQPAESVKQKIARAAGKAQAGGMKVGCYTLDTNSADYARVTGQTPAPCVLALVKGRGSSVVSGEITEDKLLAAVLTASRASSCGPSGCGPSGCN